MKRFTFGGFLAIVFFISACSSTKQVAEKIPEAEFRQLDTVFVSADPDTIYPDQVISNELPRYQQTFDRTIDIIHTKLELAFDWDQEKVLGKATIRLKPVFGSVDKIELDAKGFEIHQLLSMPDQKPLKYENTGQSLIIQLEESLATNMELFIDYTASPSEGESGSAAITSDKGLFFINSDGSKDIPQQIWTQGETEFNSRWFPTVDKPNERCTQEMYLTVQDRFTTLSNGTLVSSTKNNDGTRTDYWKMDKPHAPYLFMIAIGEFAVVEDEWNGLPLSYFVEPEYEAYAEDIFAHTPEMLSFFTDLTGIDYPWSKYAQIVVREYVSGAMENTTAVIFGDFVQKDARALVDDDNDFIVAHEMFHHWFGDLVTCESWANLTMNEGFANYSEYLWYEHKYGLDRAESHRREQLEQYLYEAQSSAHPLIHFQYEDKEDMFDAHSYNKGGLVLHMLRKIVGDDLFFAGLKSYLEDNAFTAVEVHNLRLAFEKVSGKDWNWFFNQWFLQSGHPVIQFSYAQEEDAIVCSTLQMQEGEQEPTIFELPTDLMVYYADGSTEMFPIRINQRQQTFRIPNTKEVTYVDLDSRNDLLAVIISETPDIALMRMFDQSPSYFDRLESVQRLDSENPKNAEIFQKALDDPYWEVRLAAASQFDWSATKDAKKMLNKLMADQHSQIRSFAYSLLPEVGTIEDIEKLNSVISDDTRPYSEVAAALTALTEIDSSAAVAAAEQLQEIENSSIVSGIAAVKAKSAEPSAINYFLKHAGQINNPDAFTFYAYLDNYLEKSEDPVRTQAKETLLDLASENGKPYVQISAFRSLIKLSNLTEDGAQKAHIKTHLDEVLSNVSNNQVSNILQNFMSNLQ